LFGQKIAPQSLGAGNSVHRDKKPERGSVTQLLAFQHATFSTLEEQAHSDWGGSHKRFFNPQPFPTQIFDFRGADFVPT